MSHSHIHRIPIAISELTAKPFIYCRYIDDIFVDIVDENHLMSLKSKLVEMSVLKFTVDMSVNNCIPFLNVDIDGSENKFVHSVHKKPTDNGKCLNGESECPDKYKESVIREYVHCALTHCTTWPLVHRELERLRKFLCKTTSP